MNQVEIIDFEPASYQQACEEQRALNQLKKEIAEREKTLKPFLQERSGGNRVEFGLSVKKVTVKGSIDINRIAVAYDIDEAELEEYRKPSYDRWDIRNY